MGRLVALAVLLAALVALPSLALAQDERDFFDPSSDDPGQQFGLGPLGGMNVQREDTPNDPDYDRAEGDDEDAPGVTPSTNLYDERFDLFGFPAASTRLTARYLDPRDPNVGQAQVSGLNAAGAWKRTQGDPSVAVAVLDTGINWSSSGIRTQVALKREELPPPEPRDLSAPLGGYDLNRSGVLDVDDYAGDPRVRAVIGGDRPPTGQDLIRAFSDGTDADANGYVDDIAGWDFFDDDNDPFDASSYFAASNHGTGRMNEAAERGDDGAGSIGVCPTCQVMPLRIWDTFVSDQNSFALGIVYATDNGAEVIVGADGGLYHSRFAEEATRYAYERDVTQVYSGDDLNTGNHNFPAAYTHTMLIEGVVNDAEGLGMDLPSEEEDPGLRAALIQAAQLAGVGTQIPVGTYFRSANTAQFGGKSSISMQGPTGSTNTGKAGGAAALIYAAARVQGLDDPSADEVRILLEQTAEDVLPGNTGGTGNPDPAQPGFDTHFGWGRANIGEAVRRATPELVPPEASIASPDWYAPLAGDSARITGRARDRRRAGESFTWRLEYGVGLAPAEDEWLPVSNGSSSGTVTDFGEIDLEAVRARLAARTTFDDRDDPAGPVLDPTPGLDPYQGQFTVQLVVESSDEDVIDGIDRKVLTALDDDTLRPGFPRRLGAGGEAPLRYADLDGDNEQELILPAQDGLIHAYRPDGTELPGWPVRTETQFAARAHLDSPALRVLDPPLEPPRAPTIADLDGDGLPEVMTAAGERLYAWNGEGELLDGFPVLPDADRSNCAPSQQSKPLSHPKCGFIASPAVARLQGPGEPFSIVAPALDGRLYAYTPDGEPTPGFPVRLIDTNLPEEERMTAESINNPAIGDLDGDGRDEIVVATNEVYGSTNEGGDVTFAGALSGAAGTTSRVYAVRATGTGASGDAQPFLDGWPISLPGIIQDVLPLIGPGHDPALALIDGEQQVIVSTTGGALRLYGADGTLTREVQQNATVANGSLNLFESAVVGDLAGTGDLDVVKYQIDLEQAANLLLVGQNVPYSHRIGAFSAMTGVSRPAWPVITDDYQFLSSSTIAQVRPGTSNQVVAGTGLGLLHAYDGITGRDAPGFPKVTGGWLFAPAALSDDGRMAGFTREGFLFEWDVEDAPACQTEWPSFRHDQQGTGNYDADGTPPAAPEDLAVTALDGDRFRVRFRSPGDDGFCGTATRYVADADGTAIDLGEPVAGGEENTVEVTLPAGTRRVTVRAEDGEADGASNLGAPAAVQRQVDPDPDPGPGPGDGGGNGGGGNGNGGGGNDGDGGGNDGGGGTTPPGTTPFVPVAPGPASATPVVQTPPAVAGASDRITAKLEVQRARVLRSERRLDVLAPISRRASGDVEVRFRAAGRTETFTVPVDSANGRVRFSRRIPAAQARLGTGILTLTYAGDADTRPQVVRLRAASQRAQLTLGRPTIADGRLRMAGTVSERARGLVRLQLQFDFAGQTRTLSYRAEIDDGRFALNVPMAQVVRDALVRRQGTAHSYVLFTGFFPRRVRGEMASFEILGDP